MATDIAFALGVLSLLGNRVPVALPIFLAALAIIDDLGAIVIIALFYVHDFSLLYLVLAPGIFVGLRILNRLQIASARLLPHSWSGHVVLHAQIWCPCHACWSAARLCYPVYAWR